MRIRTREEQAAEAALIRHRDSEWRRALRAALVIYGKPQLRTTIDEFSEAVLKQMEAPRDERARMD